MKNIDITHELVERTTTMRKEPTAEEIAVWKQIFEIHAKAIGKNTKPKTDSQIRKWLQNPHSDSAEYKMWGNGVALPNVIFVLSGIAFYAQLTADKFGKYSEEM